MGELGDKLEGDAKDRLGGLTGDRTEQGEGKLQKGKGEVEGARDDVKDDAERGADELRHRL